MQIGTSDNSYITKNTNIELVVTKTPIISEREQTRNELKLEGEANDRVEMQVKTNAMVSKTKKESGPNSAARDKISNSERLKNEPMKKKEYNKYYSLS